MEKNEPVAWGHPNTMITGKKHALMMVELEIPSNAQYPQLWVPLYPPDAIEAAVLTEREACAKVCEERSHRSDDMGAICAAAIRARGSSE